MAASDWVEIYRSYDPVQLATEVEDLKRQKSVFTSQTVGGKSYVKDLKALQDQLAGGTRGKFPPGIGCRGLHAGPSLR